MRWVERKFSFDKKPSDLPALVDRLSEALDVIIDIISSCRPEDLEIKPEGKWSIKEHIGHLDDLEALHEGRLDDFLAGKAVLRPADMQNRKTEEAHHNRRNITDLIDAFRQSRAAFIGKLDRFDEKMMLRSALHERLGVQMRVIDMADFMAAHDGHHLQKMREIAQSTAR